MATIISRLQGIALEMMTLEDLSHGPAAMGTRIISDANRALQEIAVLLDDSFHYKEPRGSYVQPSVQTTVDVTQGGTTIANLSGSADWMNGCSCMISGSSTINRLRKPASNFELAMPYTGPTATGVQITVWHDNVTLPEDVRSIERPVMYDDKDVQVVTEEYLRTWLRHNTRTGGVPEMAAEITAKLGDSGQKMALLLNQLPTGGAVLSYTAVGKVANFADLNDTREHVVPFDLEDSVLFPIFRSYFSTYPGVTIPKGDLATEYKAALDALQRIPKRSAGRAQLRRPSRAYVVDDSRRLNAREFYTGAGSYPS